MRGSIGGGNPLNALEDEDLYQEPVRQIIKPLNQLDLSEAELREEHTRVLTATDPNVPNNVTKYNYKDRMYKIDPPGPGDHLAVHFSMDGCLLFRELDEAKQQLAYMEKKREEEEEAKRAAAAAAAEAGEEEPEADGGAGGKGGKNQFNYSERAAQTFTNPMRDRGVATEPPPMVNFSSTIAQWEIYDHYMQEYAASQQEAEHEAARRGIRRPDGGGGGRGRGRGGGDDTVHSAKMGGVLKMLERMANQNAEDEIFQDFKYWEDASDQFREGEGSLLPLWRFSTERTKKKQVTALCWNPRYPDLFAVGYGSYDFLRQGSGLVACFSLKNTGSPEYTLATESGVMCLDFHPLHHSLLAVGCYDGTVMVFDVRQRRGAPIYSSSIKTGKHTDPVWQVHWQCDEQPKELNFYSVSSDGRVANWIMSKNELKMEPVMQLKLVGGAREEPEVRHPLNGLAGGCCFDFNRHAEHLFIVGTEEGRVHKCSKAYSGQYLQTYEGHNMAVYALRWNPFHPRVFLSCSADWTVKLWDHALPQPVMSFDLGNAVGDVCWSPYSATVFAAVTSDGKVHVFDLAQNKHEPICEQKVVKRSRLTHVCFNLRDPIIIVGDDRGGVNSLKLSPNLRKVHEPAGEDGKLSARASAQAQADNMEKLLQVADTKPTPA
ncbi:putative dynein intermediate chain [Tribonema minus]|uniref:Putative dynein intermediate chain n=1 Tax=Tribonema minus TaxID=303371 RepID=A0A835YM82_9STRA|nr:putative dynein intermediate chain [Tribonema minus]